MLLNFFLKNNGRCDRCIVGNSFRVFNDCKANRFSKRALKGLFNFLEIHLFFKIECASLLGEGMCAWAGKKYQFTTDLQNFYPSIKNDRVFDTFLKLGFSSHYSHWLTKITSWKYELPQGTPTSTHISNLVFLETDYQLIKLCNSYNITYTRYVDDLTFSSQSCFKHLLNELLSIVTDNGFRLSYRKTKYQGNQNITGIDVFNNYIDAPERIRNKAKLEKELNTELKPFSIYLNNIRKTNSRCMKPKNHS